MHEGRGQAEGADVHAGVPCLQEEVSMAKRRRQRTRFGESTTLHTQAHAQRLAEVEGFVTQANTYLNNGLCRQATDAALDASRLFGEALAHGRSVKDRERGIGHTRIAHALARLRLKVLETCTRDD
jgi:hypothetical protein